MKHLNNIIKVIGLFFLFAFSNPAAAQFTTENCETCKADITYEDCLLCIHYRGKSEFCFEPSKYSLNYPTTVVVYDQWGKMFSLIAANCNVGDYYDLKELVEGEFCGTAGSSESGTDTVVIDGTVMVEIVSGLETLEEKLCAIDSLMQLSNSTDSAALVKFCDVLESDSTALVNDSLLLACYTTSKAQDSLFYSESLINDSLSNLADSLLCEKTNQTNILLDSLISVGEESDSTLIDKFCQALENDSLSLVQDSLLCDKIDTLIKLQVDYELVTYPYCLEGVVGFIDVIYMDGEADAKTTIPLGAEFGFCLPTDTVDYEGYDSYICVDNENILVTNYYENGSYVVTTYTGSNGAIIAPPLEYENGICVEFQTLYDTITARYCEAPTPLFAGYGVVLSLTTSSNTYSNSDCSVNTNNDATFEAWLDGLGIGDFTVTNGIVTVLNPTEEIVQYNYYIDTGINQPCDGGSIGNVQFACQDSSEVIPCTTCETNQLLTEILNKPDTIKQNDGRFRCYGAGAVSDSEYQDSDNNSEGGFSIGGTSSTLMKWEYDLSNDDGIADFSDEITACIDAGEIAYLTIEGAGGSNTTFEAVSYSGSAGTYLFTGVGVASFADKLKNAYLTCGDSAPDGIAIYCGDCGVGGGWFDQSTGAVVEYSDTYECPVDCEDKNIDGITCLAEDVAGLGVIGDPVLFFGVTDCENSIKEYSYVNPTTGAEVEGGFLTQDCGSNYSLTEITSCILDEKENEWTRYAFFSDTTLVSEFFIDKDIVKVGTPAGDQGEWRSCDDQVCYPKTVCVISGENGINGKRWDSEGNAATWTGNNNTTAFPTWNTHVNGGADEKVTIIDNWSLNDLDFPVTGGIVAGVDNDISSQELYWAWINVTETMIIRDNNGNTGEYLSVFIQDCNKDMVQVVKNKYTTGADRGIEEIKELCPGIYKIAIQVFDYSVYGGFYLQYSTDNGGVWNNFPIEETYINAPVIEERCILVCPDGSTTNVDGTFFDEKTITCNQPCYPMTRETLPDTEVSITDGCDDIDGDAANYVNFTREIIFVNGVGTTTFYTNYGNEATQAEYTVVGGIVNCATGEPLEEPVVPPVCEEWAVVNVYLPTGTNGVNVERWVANATTTGTAATVPSDIFTGAVDFTGLPTHPNAPDISLTVESDLLILDQNNGRDQFRYWTWLYTTKPIRLRELFNRAESVDYYLGECEGDVLKNATGAYPNTVAQGAAFDVALAPGRHLIGGTVHDFSAYSGINYQYSEDNGVTWSRVPASWLFTQMPSVTNCPAWSCQETGVCTDLKTGLELPSNASVCEPELCGATPTGLTCTIETFYKIEYPAQGTVEQRWDVSAAPMTGATGEEYRSAFTVVDAEGYPAIATPADVTISNTTSTTTNFNSLDQAQSDFYIYLTEPTELREYAAFADAVGVWISESCGSDKMVEVVNAGYTNTVANPIGLYPAGCYRVRLYVADFSANGAATLQGKTNGVWANIPAYPTKPTVTVIKGNVCDDGINRTQDKSEILDETWTCEDPRCNPSANVPASSIVADDCAVEGLGGGGNITTTTTYTDVHSICIYAVAATVQVTTNDNATFTLSPGMPALCYEHPDECGILEGDFIVTITGGEALVTTLK